jgi:hypothetical protein
MFFSSQAQLFHMRISQSYFLMQGAPPNQMGVRYPCMLLVLLLLHGANAASKDPEQKWQTLSGKYAKALYFRNNLFE